jgi:exonuclease SbcC
MAGARLKSLVVENFRSLRGKVVIPLDAQVVLIHGTNGMGKTSVLSALELGLTGRVAHLANSGSPYKSYITTLGTNSGSISLSTSASVSNASPNMTGVLDFSDARFSAQPLLDLNDGRFFSERCYLPQATLGRLLEIYNERTTGATSPLTLFVKELLGLDPLDAIIDGLDHAFHVSRIRKLVPDFRRLEALKSSLLNERASKERAIKDAAASATERLGRLNQFLNEIPGRDKVLAVPNSGDLDDLKIELSAVDVADRELINLSKMRSELRGLHERWSSLPSQDVSRGQADRERADQLANEAVAAWRSGRGNELEKAFNAVRVYYPDLPSLDVDPEKSRFEAERSARSEADRCERLLNAHAKSSESVKTLQAVAQRATVRIDELTRDLSGAAEDARSLAQALAGVVPHITGDKCPVCERDYAEHDTKSLSTHVAGKIASLTSEAGRLQALATARAEESERLNNAERELLSAEKGLLPAEDVAELTVRKALMVDLAVRLAAAKEDAADGAKLMHQVSAARQVLLTARRRDEQSVSLIPEIDSLMWMVMQRSTSEFPSLDVAFAEATRIVDERISAAQRVAGVKIKASSELALYVGDLDQLAKHQLELEKLVKQLNTVEGSLRGIETIRGRAKKISEAAAQVRSDIVKKVFSESLNKIWRDLFVRLAPSEQFVPTFKLPLKEGGKVEAVLETVHRSGKVSGSPGAMLSQGNLNTAALTLFLGLHLSVPVRMPWLILDDPVQSMDDVHIAQFAALLRSISKGIGRQVIVAVHERALFDYLTLELSPAFPGDSLITVEITRSFEGETIATPRAFSFEEDGVLAA